MNNMNNPNQTRRGRMSIGSAAARSREELEKFEEKERRRKDAVKKEKELLERQLSQLESQARQAARAENLKEEKRVCYLLGEIILKALRAQGMTDVQVTRSDLNQLAPDNLSLVSTVAERKKGSTAPLLLPTPMKGIEPDLDDIPF